jgi:cleavage and polyadenylation specificity factor subunit 3
VLAYFWGVNADVHISLSSPICLSPFYHPELEIELELRMTALLLSLTPVTAHKHTHSHGGHLHKHRHPHANSEGELSSMTRVRRLAMFLEAHFGEVEFHQPDGSDSEEREAGERNDEEPSLLVRLDEADARIDLISLVSSKNKHTAF